MKMYVMRHEVRDPVDVSFTSGLVPEGQERAGQLVQTLKDLGVTHVYSSPYLRCLQTVQPFMSANENSMEQIKTLAPGVRVDYCLCEQKSKECPEVHPVPSDWYEEMCLDPTYESLLPPETLQAQEGHEGSQDLHLRTANFIKFLARHHTPRKKSYQRISDTITELGRSMSPSSSPRASTTKGPVLLLVTHQTVAHSLIHQCNATPVNKLNFLQGQIEELEWKFLLESQRIG